MASIVSVSRFESAICAPFASCTVTSIQLFGSGAVSESGMLPVARMPTPRNGPVIGTGAVTGRPGWSVSCEPSPWAGVAVPRTGSLSSVTKYLVPSASRIGLVAVACEAAKSMYVVNGTESPGTPLISAVKFLLMNAWPLTDRRS